VKSKLYNKQLWNPNRQLQDAATMVAFLNEAMSFWIIMSSTRTDRGDIYRYFHEVCTAAIPREEP
jgi:hypothetical protein